MANSNQLRDAFCETLLNILSPDKAVRNLAEKQLAMLEMNEDYTLQLMELSLSEDLDFSVRHLASVILDQYIMKHWTEIADKFEAPEVPATIKPLIREYLLKSLAISPTVTHGDQQQLDHATKKLLNSYAHSLSRIAQFDWPGQWPELFPVLHSYLASGQPSAIYSTLKVFKELAHEIVDTQIPNVAPILLPQMLNIFISPPGQFSVRTRGHALKIFVTISETVMVMNEFQKDSIKTYLAPHIPRLAEAFIGTLLIPDGSPDVDIGLKKDVISAVTMFLKNCRKYFKIYLPKIMELIWNALTTTSTIYVQRVVNSDSYDSLDTEDAIYAETADSDGETIGFNAYIHAIIEFVMNIFDSTKYRELIKPVLPELFYYIIFYTQITDDQVSEWSSSLDQFLEDDDLDSIGFSVRLSAQDLIVSLADEMASKPDVERKDDEHFKMSFLQAIKRHFAEAHEMEKRRDPSKPWWKPVEACLYCLGIISETIIHTIKSHSTTPLANEYKAILDTVLSNTTHLNEPFLAGRSIWTASRFSPIMNDQSLENFLRMTANVLGLVDRPVLRIFALRSTYYFCDNVSVNQKVHVIKPILPQFLQGLVSVGLHSTSGEILHLVLQTIAILLKLDKDFTASVAGSVCSLATSTILQYPDDPLLFEVALNLYNELFAIERTIGELQARLCPTIISVLQARPSTIKSEIVQIALKSADDREEFRPIANILTLQPAVLDILASLVRKSPLPLSDVLIQQVYPAMIACLQSASKEDTAILQNGAECIRHYVAKSTDQLMAYVDPATNLNGIQMALNICNSLLSPQTVESAGSFIGRLIVTLILKANHMIGHENIQNLLRSTLVKLNTTKETVITESLILVFAHLLYMDLEAILVFLNSLPAPDGRKSALEFVLDKWLKIQMYFMGYDNKASTMALARMFQHSLATADGSAGGSGDLALINLHRIEVDCEEERGTTARTRSMTKQDETKPRKVPATVKILKMLINEYNHVLELKQAAAEGSDTDETDEDDDSDDGAAETDAAQIEGLQNLLAAVRKDKLLAQEILDLPDQLTSRDLGLDDDDFEEDEILSEELAAIDMEEVLKQVLSNFKQVPAVASEFLVHLTPAEQEMLKRV